MAHTSVLLAGLGPAGLALAAACAARGIEVRAHDPLAGRPWRATYGLWAPEWEAACEAFPALAAVPTRVTASPALLAPRRGADDARRSPGGRDAGGRDAVGARLREGRVAEDYVVVDSRGLRETLLSHCPSLVTSEVPLRTDELLSRRSGGTRVVDCRGAVPPDLSVRGRGIPAQSAFGVVVPDAAAEPVLDGRDGMLMDWRDPGGRRGTPGDGAGARGGGAGGAAREGAARPSFLYAVRLPGGRTLLEETDLAGVPALGIAELRARLATRLGWQADGLRAGGTPARGVEVEDTERVHFPLRPAGRPRGLECFGTAAGAGHPATGYSVAASLLGAGAAAEAILRGEDLPAATSAATAALHRAGLEALLGIDGAALREMFGAFGEMDVRRQTAFLDRGSAPGGTVAAMAAQWWRTDPRTRLEVATAVARAPWSNRRSARESGPGGGSVGPA